MSEIQLTDNQKAFVQRGIDSGRYAREEDAVRETLGLWKEIERTRAELLAKTEIAERSAAGGKGIVITAESMRQLSDEVKQRGRARLAAEQRHRSD